MTTQTPDAVREAVARIVDPDAFDPAVEADATYPVAMRRLQLRRTEALDKADAILAALDSRAGDAGEADQTKADYCPGYCARGEPHNGPHDPIVLNRQSGGQTAEVLNATPAPAVDAKARTDMAAALRNTPAEALREAGYLERAAQMIEAPAVDADEVTLLRTALHEIDQIAGTTIPPDGDAAAWSALEAIIKLIHPFRTNGAYPPRTPPAVDAVPAGEVGKAREVLSFLNGEGPLDGLYFDESDRPERPRYWWRAHLAALSHGEGRK